MNNDPFRATDMLQLQSNEDFAGCLENYWFGFLFLFQRFNSVEQRGLLAMIGIGSIGLGIVTTYGLAGLFGVKNTSMNSILPFLLL